MRRQQFDDRLKQLREEAPWRRPGWILRTIHKYHPLKSVKLWDELQFCERTQRGIEAGIVDPDFPIYTTSEIVASTINADRIVMNSSAAIVNPGTVELGKSE